MTTAATPVGPDVVEHVEVDPTAFAAPDVTTAGHVPGSEPVGLHVRRWHGGEHRPVLLVHGLASNARLWDGVAPVLAGAGHPVAAVDLRGHGRSDKPDDGYDVPIVAGDLRALVEALDWERPVVAGQSWGGNVVLELAASWPEAVGALAGIDGGTIELHRRFPDWDACVAALRPPPLAGTPRDRIERMLRDAHPDWPESGIQGQLACLEVRDDGTVAPWLTLERHLLVLRGLWEHRPRERYGSVTAPTLLLGADPGPAAADFQDERTAGIGDAAATIADVRVEWLRGDHDLHAQHPEAVAALLLELAARADGA